MTNRAKFTIEINEFPTEDKEGVSHFHARIINESNQTHKAVKSPDFCDGEEHQKHSSLVTLYDLIRFTVTHATIDEAILPKYTTIKNEDGTYTSRIKLD